MKNANEIISAAIENGTAQLLTIEAAKSLKGKKIITKYFGYRGQDDVETFVVGDITTEWLLAEKEIDARFAPYKSQAEYWDSYMSDDQKREFKMKLVLLSDTGKNFFIRCDSRFDDTFHCSDSDRHVFYVVVDEPVIIRHSTKGFFQAPNNWIVSEEMAAKWATRFTIDAAEVLAPTLTSLSGSPLKVLELVRLNGPKSEFKFWSYEIVKTITNA